MGVEKYTKDWASTSSFGDVILVFSKENEAVLKKINQLQLKAILSEQRKSGEKSDNLQKSLSAIHVRLGVTLNKLR